MSCSVFGAVAFPYLIKRKRLCRIRVRPMTHWLASSYSMTVSTSEQQKRDRKGWRPRLLITDGCCFQANALVIFISLKVWQQESVFRKVLLNLLTLLCNAFLYWCSFLDVSIVDERGCFWYAVFKRWMSLYLFIVFLMNAHYIWMFRWIVRTWLYMIFFWRTLPFTVRILLESL